MYVLLESLYIIASKQVLPGDYIKLNSGSLYIVSHNLIKALHKRHAREGISINPRSAQNAR